MIRISALKQFLRKLILLFITLFVSSCGSSDYLYVHTPADESHTYYEIDADIEDDEKVSAYIAPYIRDMENSMGQVLTVSEGPFESAVPEGALGNLVADIVRYRAIAEMRANVHVSVINNGGLQVPLPEGEITVGHIYYLIPSENKITVLKFSGTQLEKIARELAAVNGEPVSGIRFRIVDGTARDILVDSMNLDPNRYYWVATSTWLADGGGDVPTLWEPVERRNFDVLIRDALKDYLWAQETISPYVDQRVRN